MTLTALGIDIMLPVFAELRSYFRLPPESTATSQIIVFFFMGQIAQLPFGILSDRIGRIPLLRIGFPLYIIGGIAAAMAPTIELMLAARFVAGVGASAVFMTTVAGVRDRFAGDEMARVMSLILTIFLFTPIAAPFLGIAILSAGSWQGVFFTPPLFALAVFVWSMRLDESLPHDKRIPIDLKSISHSMRSVIMNKTFLRYTCITTILFTGLSSYVASSERIVGEIYHRPELFPWLFAGIGLLMSLCSLINSRLSAKFGARRALTGLLILYTIIAATLLLISVIADGAPGIVVFFISVAALMAINIAIEPNSSAMALEPMGSVAGIAAATYGTLFFFVGSALGSIINSLMVTSVFPLVVGFFLFGILSLILIQGDHQKKI